MPTPPNRLGFAHDRAGVDVRAVRGLQFGSPTEDDCAPSGSAPPVAPRDESSGAAPYVRAVHSPRIEKLPQSRAFYVDDYTIILPPGGAVSPASLTFKLPTNQAGFLQEFGLFIQTPTNLTRVKWTVTINGGPVPGLSNVSVPPMVLSGIWIPVSDLWDRIDPGGVVGVTITNYSAAGPWTVGAFLSGWYHPLSAEKSWWGSRV